MNEPRVIRCLCNLCNLRQEPFFRRWIITQYENEECAWSGSRWVPIGGCVQICNFDSRAQADSYATGAGLCVIE